MKRFIAALTLVLILALLAVPAQAKAPRNGKYIDASGNIFIMKNGRPRTGHFKYKGKWYYGHKTNDGPYVKGSCTAGEMRVERGNKWYAYNLDGTMIRKDQYVHRGRRRILQLDIRIRNHTVRYVYGTARGSIGSRYSTREGRMQFLDDDGEWRTYEGMPYYPPYVDDRGLRTVLGG